MPLHFCGFGCSSCCSFSQWKCENNITNVSTKWQKNKRFKFVLYDLRTVHCTKILLTYEFQRWRFKDLMTTTVQYNRSYSRIPYATHVVIGIISSCQKTMTKCSISHSFISSILEKGFGALFLWRLQFRIVRMPQRQWKTIDRFRKPHHQIVRRDFGTLDRHHGLFGFPQQQNKI